MIKNKRTEKLRDEGVTLIALVVTIIILLILAGITLRTMLVNGGLIGKAQQASNTMSEVTENEKTTMKGMKNKIYEIKTGLNNSETSKPESSITIYNSNGEKIDLAEISEYYGKNITYKNRVCKIYLVDTEGKYSGGKAGVWIQYDEFANTDGLNNHCENTGIQNDNSVFWQVNPNLDNQFGSKIRALSTQALNGDGYLNLRATAYLCNPDNWTSTYVEVEDIEEGAYAIGGVSAEMWCDSYNIIRAKESTDADYFKTKSFETELPSPNITWYGYYFQPVDEYSAYHEGYGDPTDFNNYPLSHSDYGGMYCWEGKSSWIASPASNTSFHLCLESEPALVGDDCSFDSGFGYYLRPAVFLPASIPITIIN